MNSQNLHHPYIQYYCTVWYTSWSYLVAIPPCGELSVAPTRYWVTCGFKPRIFFSFFGPFPLHAVCPMVLVCSVTVWLGYPKVAGHCKAVIQYCNNTIHTHTHMQCTCYSNCLTLLLYICLPYRSSVNTCCWTYVWRNGLFVQQEISPSWSGSKELLVFRACT